MLKNHKKNLKYPIYTKTYQVTQCSICGKVIGEKGIIELAEEIDSHIEETGHNKIENSVLWEFTKDSHN